jgi:hypothetical protein
MTVETQILNYLNSLHPALQFSMLHANHIVTIMQSQPDNSAYAKLSRYNAMKNGYDPIRVIRTNDEAIKQAIVKALSIGVQPQGGYLYECYNSNGQFEGKIFSLNPELF